MKRLIAYSSVSHLGFCMLGVFAINRLGMEGGVLQMINHGLSTGGLFALVGMLYERYHTRNIGSYGGIARRLPILAFFMLLLTLSSIGLPGLNGFVGEFLSLLGMFQRAWADPPAENVLELRVISVVAVAGVILGAWYMLQLVQRVFFGPLREPAVSHAHGPDHAGQPVVDLKAREIVALSLLAVFILWIGIWPEFFLSRMRPTLTTITARAQAALDEGSGFRVQGSGSEAQVARQRTARPSLALSPAPPTTPMTISVAMSESMRPVDTRRETLAGESPSVD
jgi:NADH-quinone oxidoreductase subunit M